MAKELRWGILACGKISADYVTSLRKCANPNVVVAAAASSLERAKQFCEKHCPSAKAYGSYEELLADASVDVVYIGIVNDAHVTWTLKALDAGKHVLCEKPLGVTSKEVKQMIAKAQEKKLFLMEAFWSRFFPAWQTIRKTIQSKELGNVKAVHANFGVLLPTDTRFDVKHAESPISDIGLYTVMFANWCFQAKPEKINVVGHKDPKDGADRWGNITLQFPGGGRAALFYDGTINAANSGFISFDNGQIQLPEFFWCPTKLIKITGSPAEAKNIETLQFPLGDDANYVYNHSSGLRYEADHTYECIAKGKTESDVMPFADSLAIAEILEEVRRQLGVVYPQDSA